VSASSIKSSDQILEIGPGLGFVTEELLKTGAKVTAVEIDERFKPRLNDLAYQYPNFNYLIDNGLNLFGRENHAPTDNWIYGSLSYAIFEPLLFKLICYQFKQAVFLVSERFLKEEGIIRIILNTFFNWEIVVLVDRSLFYPSPKYSGVIIRLVPTTKDEPGAIFWRELILQRDKKIKNSLRETLIKHRATSNINLTKRAAENIIDSYFKTGIDLNKYFSSLNKREIKTVAIGLINMIENRYTPNNKIGQKKTPGQIQRPFPPRPIRGQPEDYWRNKQSAHRPQPKEGKK
jgi:16S rRNA A1518/A1519 N6-dimethyltransferase RsmA/KsgA/DIM1 with predicted DNA glycosylase/AP lyase activity